MDISLLAYTIMIVFVAIILYNYGLLLSSLWRKERSTSYSESPKNPFPNFLILVPAHNEEAVIRELARDLLNQDYPPESFRVIIIADNCTDRTREVLRDYEGEILKVLERKSKIRGKGPALDYGLEMFPKIFRFNPDYVVVFDADNRVPRDFLKKLSIHAKNNYPAIQCNIRTKNPNDSLLTKAQYYEYLVFQRVWQGGKENLGLFNALGGTGMAIRFDVISRLGFGSSLVEDLDLTVRMALNGMKVKFVFDPVVFDEKPSKLSIDIARRTRWAIGFIQTFLKYGLKLLKTPSKITLDGFIHLAMVFGPLFVWTSYIMTILGAIGVVWYESLPPVPGVLFSLAFAPLFIFTALVEEGGGKFVKYIIPSLVYVVGIWLITVPLAILNIARGHVEWKKTPHGVR